MDHVRSLLRKAALLINEYAAVDIGSKLTAEERSYMVACGLGPMDVNKIDSLKYPKGPMRARSLTIDKKFQYADFAPPTEEIDLELECGPLLGKDEIIACAHLTSVLIDNWPVWIRSEPSSQTLIEEEDKAIVTNTKAWFDIKRNSSGRRIMLTNLDKEFTHKNVTVTVEVIVVEKADTKQSDPEITDERISQTTKRLAGLQTHLSDQPSLLGAREAHASLLVGNTYFVVDLEVSKHKTMCDQLKPEWFVPTPDALLSRSRQVKISVETAVLKQDELLASATALIGHPVIRTERNGFEYLIVLDAEVTDTSELLLLDDCWGQTEMIHPATIDIKQNAAKPASIVLTLNDALMLQVRWNSADEIDRRAAAAEEKKASKTTRKPATRRKTTTRRKPAAKANDK